MGRSKNRPHGQWSNKRGQGEGVTFLRQHVNDSDGECLIWPLYRNPNGYAQFGFEGTEHYAHRFMCELANGPPPSPDYDAAHSCGRGKNGCVHPRHLSWKTRGQNIEDAVAHGTHIGNRWTNRGRLRPDQVIEIRRLKGQKTQVEIAVMFGVTPPTVRDIYLGRTYRSVPLAPGQKSP